MLHDLPARPETIHWGYFDATQAPALTVKSGDLIRAEAVTHHAGDAPDLMMDDAIREIYRKVPHDDRHPGVHIMTGPIYVEDAKPGDVLEVRYLQMIPRFRFGANVAASWGRRRMRRSLWQALPLRHAVWTTGLREPLKEAASRPKTACDRRWPCDDQAPRHP
ncbi:protein of unknown function (plasmid) [Cupriavidus neocaledonicus]|uniref:Acetamidase n=1 Tax=Cupriavidus neocaledonicus TaxID=1040979 RepID=A0A375HTM0_9BURK|nr:hypothetical protein CBM2605_B50033 [Cupriavidus neocaledonicus]SPD60805.1 protein of unknown function [Cupriavidus neocaledonicus]